MGNKNQIVWDRREIPKFKWEKIPADDQKRFIDAGHPMAAFRKVYLSHDESGKLFHYKPNVKESESSTRPLPIGWFEEKDKRDNRVYRFYKGLPKPRSVPTPQKEQNHRPDEVILQEAQTREIDGEEVLGWTLSKRAHWGASWLPCSGLKP